MAWGKMNCSAHVTHLGLAEGRSSDAPRHAVLSIHGASVLANHLSTRPLALPFAGGDAAHAESASAVAMMLMGLRVMTHPPVAFEVSARAGSWYALHSRKSSGP